MRASLASVQGWTVDKPPEPGRGLSGLARKARKRGAPLFGYFLSGKREKVTRPPQEDETLLLL